MLRSIRQLSAPTASERRARQIRLRAKILVVAIAVGLGLSVNCAQAQAPLATKAMLMTPKEFAHMRVMNQWGNKIQYSCLLQLWERESHWNPLAHNKSSGAFGIPQFLPQTWGNYKFPYKPKDATIQITAGLRYITKRYGSPCKAWAFWQHKAKQGNPWY